jgi:hypothetical protein
VAKARLHEEALSHLENGYAAETLNLPGIGIKPLDPAGNALKTHSE